MTGQVIDRMGTRPRGNLGVPAGAVIILICFFLPWIRADRSSAMEMLTDPQKAVRALGGVRPADADRLAWVRLLCLIPILALLTLGLEVDMPAGHPRRFVARLGILAAGGVLTAFFAFFGMHLGPKLTYGFWSSLTGALFISVGGLFDAVRGE